MQTNIKEDDCQLQREARIQQLEARIPELEARIKELQAHAAAIEPRLKELEQNKDKSEARMMKVARGEKRKAVGVDGRGFQLQRCKKQPVWSD